MYMNFSMYSIPIFDLENKDQDADYFDKNLQVNLFAKCICVPKLALLGSGVCSW